MADLTAFTEPGQGLSSSAFHDFLAYFNDTEHISSPTPPNVSADIIFKIVSVHEHLGNKHIFPYLHSFGKLP